MGCRFDRRHRDCYEAALFFRETPYFGFIESFGTINPPRASDCRPQGGYRDPGHRRPFRAMCPETFGLSFQEGEENGKPTVQTDECHGI